MPGGLSRRPEATANKMFSSSILSSNVFLRQNLIPCRLSWISLVRAYGALAGTLALDSEFYGIFNNCINAKVSFHRCLNRATFHSFFVQMKNLTFLVKQLYSETPRATHGARWARCRNAHLSPFARQVGVWKSQERAANKFSGHRLIDSGGAFLAKVTHVIPDNALIWTLSGFFATAKRTVAKNTVQSALFATVDLPTQIGCVAARGGKLKQKRAVG